MTDPITLHADNGEHDVAVEALYGCAFGPGRHAKAAARLREGNVCLREYSFLALADCAVVGACRLWPAIASNGVQALFLGPIAVDNSLRGAGLGERLLRACLAAIDEGGDTRTVILVGDLAYFGKIGFEIVPHGAIGLRGPVVPTRLLWRLGRQLPAPGGLLSVPRAASLRD